MALRLPRGRRLDGNSYFRFPALATQLAVLSAHKKDSFTTTKRSYGSLKLSTVVGDRPDRQSNRDSAATLLDAV